MLLAEEEAVAGSAPTDAVPGQLVLAVDTELAVARTHREDHGARRMLGAVGEPNDLDVTGQLNLGHIVGDELGAETLRLTTEVVHEYRTHDSFGKSGEVLHVSRGHQGAAGRHRTLED